MVDLIYYLTNGLFFYIFFIIIILDYQQFPVVFSGDIPFFCISIYSTIFELFFSKFLDTSWNFINNFINSQSASCFWCLLNYFFWKLFLNPSAADCLARSRFFWLYFSLTFLLTFLPMFLITFSISQMYTRLLNLPDNHCW